jgi:hypothetical protein
MTLHDFHLAVLDLTRAELSRLDPGDPTRSAIGWTAVDTIDHLVAVNALCANATRQIDPSLPGPPDAGGVPVRLADESALDAWLRTADAVTAAFAPAAANLDVPMPTPLGRPFPGSVVLTQNALENLLHLCDLGPLLGAPPAVPDEMIAEALGRILERRELWDEFRRRGMYADAIVADPDATPFTRLLAYTGRPAG